MKQVKLLAAMLLTYISSGLIYAEIYWAGVPLLIVAGVVIGSLAFQMDQ